MRDTQRTRNLRLLRSDVHCWSRARSSLSVCLSVCVSHFLTRGGGNNDHKTKPSRQPRQDTHTHTAAGGETKASCNVMLLFLASWTSHLEHTHTRAHIHVPNSHTERLLNCELFTCSTPAVVGVQFMFWFSKQPALSGRVNKVRSLINKKDC